MILCVVLYYGKWGSANSKVRAFKIITVDSKISRPIDYIPNHNISVSCAGKHKAVIEY
jgi:hypothetical protein